jgi:hypothetical protein
MPLPCTSTPSGTRFQATSWAQTMWPKRQQQQRAWSRRNICISAGTGLLAVLALWQVSTFGMHLWFSGQGNSSAMVEAS